MPEDQPQSGTFRMIIAVFGVGVTTAGLCCFGLQEGWGTSMSPESKMPIYFLLGTTLSFAFIFGFGEIVNFCVQACQEEDSPPVFNSSKSVILLVIIATLMGAVEGLVFGGLDAEDDIYLRNQFQETNSVCVPIGGAMGAFLCLVNASFRAQPQYSEVAGKDRTDPYQSI